MSIFTSAGNERDEVLEIYKKEILLKATWIVQLLAETNEMKNADLIIRNVISALTYSMSIVRLIDPLGARNSNLATERANFILNRWSPFPNPPQGLREIRNDIEHFEERLDIWADTSLNHSIIDRNVGINPTALGTFNIGSTELLRNIDDQGFFVFWNNRVDLREVLNWANEIQQLLK